MNIPKSSACTNSKPCPELAALRAAWPNLPPVQRSEKLQALVDKGYSRRSLARTLGCSESSVRDLLKLQALTHEEKEQVDKGSMSVRKALRTIKSRESHDGNTAKPKAAAKKRAEVEPFVPVFREWVRSLKLQNELIVRNLFFRLKGAKGRVDPDSISTEEAQRWQSCRDMTSEEVIDDSRPQRQAPDDRRGPGRYLSYLTEWFGRWASRLVPDQESRRVLVDAAERQFMVDGPERWNTYRVIP